MAPTRLCTESPSATSPGSGSARGLRRGEGSPSGSAPGTLRAADIHRRHRDRFADRGDGLLALIHPDHAPRMLLRRVIPAFGLLLAEHNAGRPLQRQLRVRVVVHAGTVFYDANGCFGETLDTAFRLLDAPSVKGALRTARAPLVLVVSARLDGFVHPGKIGQAVPPVSVQVAGSQHEGRVSVLPG
jgi:hypothetical protein